MQDGFSYGGSSTTTSVVKIIFIYPCFFRKINFMANVDGALQIHTMTTLIFSLEHVKQRENCFSELCKWQFQILK